MSYTGEQLDEYQANIVCLANAFATLLPELFNRGTQQNFTNVKETFPRIKSHSITDPVLHARAREEDESLCNSIKTVVNACEFIRNAFEQGTLNQDSLTRDEDTALQCYNLIHSALNIIHSSLKTANAYDKCIEAFDEVLNTEHNSEVTLKLLKYKSASEDDKKVLKGQIEDAFSSFTTSKANYKEEFKKFHDESKTLAGLRRKPFNICFSKYAFLNAILCQEKSVVGNVSIREYFVNQEALWNAALGKLTEEPRQNNLPTALNQSQETSRKFNFYKQETETLVSEITRGIQTMTLSQLETNLGDLQSSHNALRSVAWIDDPPDVLKQSKSLIVDLRTHISMKIEDKKKAEERQKAEISANLRSMQQVKMIPLTGFQDFLSWKKCQDKLNSHTDPFKKAAALLATLHNQDDKKRCEGIYDFDTLMEILKVKYSHQEKLVPALINKMRRLPEPHNENVAVMRENIGIILNTYHNLKSMSAVAVSRFDATVVEDLILKLTERTQEFYEMFLEQNHNKDFVLDVGDESQTHVSGESIERQRLPQDASPDESARKRELFLIFLKRTETRLSNLQARRVNLTHSAKASQAKTCKKCNATRCKCRKSSLASGVYSAQSDSEKVCPVCPTSKPHFNRNRKPTKSLSACKTFRQKSVTERRSIVQKFKACHICLNLNHFAKDCTREYRCNNCQGRHNILLCTQDKNIKPSTAPSAPPMEEIDADSNFVKTNSGQSFLAVSGARVIDSKGIYSPELTCLWDSGSQLNFIQDSAAKKLGYVGEPTTINLTRVGVFSSPLSTFRYWITLRSNSNKKYKVMAYGVPSIGHRKEIPSDILNYFSKLFNLDQDKINNRYGDIQILMGVPNLALHPTRIKLIENVELLKSQFGKPFMVIGSVPSRNQHQHKFSCNFINAEIRDYLTNDSLGLNLTPRCSVCLKTPECKSCKLLTQPISFKEQEEAKLIKQSIDFDYEKKEIRVSYPYLKDPRKIFPPDQTNYKLALKLCNNLKNSLTRDGLISEYQSNWDEMTARGVIRELSDEEIVTWEQSGNPVNYCSHHAVLKDSKSTKCRIVTNSSLAHNGTSLNSILPKGPNAISNLLHVLLRFRSKPFLLIADLSKAYNTVKTSELDCHLRRFLWYRSEDFKNPNQKPRIFGLNRMHFGDTVSGFILESAKEEISNYARDNLKQPILSEKILSESYVDDMVPCFETLKEAEEIKESLPIAFGSLGFNIKEITVNGPGIKLEKRVEPEHLLGHLYHLDTDELEIKFVVNFSKKRRGQKTQPNLDSKSSLDYIPITKRSILSLLASQYDPLGLCSPFLAKYKIFQAKLHRKYPSSHGWDDPVDKDDHAEGLKLVREMILASESTVNFQRSVKPEGFKLQKIICFSDGSIHAFQAVLYGVYVGPNGEVHTSILTAKNRVTSERVPRSELCGIVAACRLILNFFEAVSEASEVKEVNFLSDSTCCMDWISDYYNTKDIYVINRILEIRKSVTLLKVPTSFFWIRSGLNIADKGTKSDCKFAFLSSDEWQHGPSWIKDVANSSAQLKHSFNMENDENPAMAYAVAIEPDPVKDDIWSKLLETHNLKKVLRVWFLVKNIFAKKSFKSERSAKIISLYDAFKFFVKLSQEEKPVEELKTKQLVMFKEDGVLWTKMRFPDETLNKVFKKPQLPVLSSKSRFGKILLRYAHSAHMFRSIHAGIHQTLVNSRVGPFGAYITHAKQSIRGIISQCIVCRKMTMQTQDAKMGPRRGGFGTIPKDGSCFNMIAIDYFGPFLAKPPKIRNTRINKHYKIWGCAILCQQSRGIKIYPIEGYDTQSFITVFKTHCSLHGTPTSVLSDPMSAFKAASKEVSSSEDNSNNSLMLQQTIEETFGVQWTFIPPGSQWRDPAERAIKSIKQMMDSVFSCEKGKPVLTLNEYWCLFSEISEMLNRRPIQGAIFEGTVSLISPNQLILGRTSKDQPVTLPNNIKARERLKLISDIKAAFWKSMISVFAGDSRLFKYTTWYKQSRVPKVNDIVLLLYKSKINDYYRIAKIVNVSQDGRNLEILVAPLQDGSISNFKLTTKMSVPTQRTILLYSPTDDNSENCD